VSLRCDGRAPVNARGSNIALRALVVAAALTVTGCASTSQARSLASLSSATADPLAGSPTGPITPGPITTPGPFSPAPSAVRTPSPAGQVRSATPGSTQVTGCSTAKPVVCSSPTLPPGGLPAPAPIPIDSPTETLGAGHTLGVADRGALVVLKVGQHIDLVLQPLDAQANWVPTKVEGTGLVTVSTGGGYPSNSPLQVTFAATTAGNATITTGTDMACFHQKPPCLPPVDEWSATVHITS
jgi:hypothetical protein